MQRDRRFFQKRPQVSKVSERSFVVKARVLPLTFRGESALLALIG